MSGRPRIPTTIEREILIESGHRCAVCGAPCPLERAHIVPWRKSREHKAEDMICLCANCHERAHKENWGEKTLREYKQRPWVMREYGRVDSSPKATATIILTIEDVPDFDEGDQGLLTSAIAGLLRIPPHTVRINSIERSSIEITVELPAESAETLLTEYSQNDPELRRFLAPFVLLDFRREAEDRQPIFKEGTMCVVDILIICALEEEAKEITERLDIDPEESKTIGGYKCYFSIVRRRIDAVTGKNGPPLLRVAIAELGSMGNLPSLHATSLLLQELSPHYVILAGICGGIINPEMKLGDIVLSDRVIYYEPGKVLASEYEGREKRFFEDAPDQEIGPLMTAAKGIIDGGWDAKQNIRVPWPDKERERHRPKVHEGVVCSGEKVIANSKYAEELRSLHAHIVSIEMEAAGVAYACQNTDTEFLVIKGVSDFADEDKSDGPKRSYAKASAAAFVTFMLKEGDMVIPRRKSPKLALSDLFRLQMNERVLVVLPGYPNPRHRELGTKMINYPYNEYETAYDDVYCAFRILSALESRFGSENVKYNFDQNVDSQSWNSCNVIVIGCSLANTRARTVLQDSRAHFTIGTNALDHAIVDRQKRTVYSPGEVQRADGTRELIKDYSFISVFTESHRSIVVLGGCRAYGQVLIGDLLSEGDIVEEIFRYTPRGDFQCILSVSVMGRSYNLDCIEELVVRDRMGSDWVKLPAAVESINKLAQKIRARLVGVQA